MRRNAVSRGTFCVLLAAVGLSAQTTTSAQKINQLELSYAHVQANASIDTSLIIEGASVGLNQGTIDYTRYFGLLHRLAWVEAAVPVAGFGGLFTGTNIQGSTTGSQSSKLSGPRIRHGTRASQRPGPCRLQREL